MASEGWYHNEPPCCEAARLRSLLPDRSGTGARDDAAAVFVLCWPPHAVVLR